MKLAVRFALVMVGVAVIPIALTGWMSTDVASRSMAESRADQQAAITAGHARFVSTWLDDQLGFLSSWRDVYGERLLQMDAEHTTGFLRQVYRSTRAVSVVGLVGAEGEALAPPVFMSQARDSRTAVDVPMAEALLRAKPPTQPTSSRPIVLGVPRPQSEGVGPRVPVWVYMAGEEGRDVVLVALLSLREVEETLLEASGERRGLALLDGAGGVVVGASHPLVEGGLLTSLIGTDSSFKYALQDVGEVHGETRPVGSYGWTLVVAEPSSVLLAPARAIRRTLTWVAVANLLLALILANLSSRSLAGPLGRIQEAARRVGQGEFGQTVGDAPGGEIGDLVHAFDEMSVRLKEQHDEIEAFQGDLQHRVEARTQELREAQQALILARERAAVSELGAGLAHELNNPLSSVLGLIQVLRQGGGDPEKQALLLVRLEEEAARCREVVHAMLRLSSSEASPDVRVETDLAPLLRDVLRLATGAYAQRGLEVAYATTGEPLPVRVEGTNGSSVLAAVLDALRLGLSKGDRLEVSASVKREWIEVYFTPDPPIDRARLMEDEWRIAGFGLWVARELAHRNGAELHAPSAGSVGWTLRFQRGRHA